MNLTRIQIAKIGIWILALSPLVRLIYLGMQDQLTANPIEFIERSTGTWALVFLLLSLSMTPIRLMLNLTWVIQLRRLLGLWMFAYACFHFMTYLWLDFAFMLDEIIIDIGKHPRILVGFAAFILAIPLAITSNQAMIKKLKTRWKKLHQLVYVIAFFAVVHFLLLVKKDLTEPLYYAAAFVILMGVRVYHHYNKKPN